MRKKPTKPRRPTRLGIEEFEPRQLMSAQAVAECAFEAAPESSPEVFPTLASAHHLSGLLRARNDYGFSGLGQTVAVIDSGIAYDHTSLGAGFGAGSRVVGGWDFTEENDANPYDDGGAGSHGTHVAGIIGSTHSVHTGVAPGVDLVALRVFNDAGQGNFAWVEQALQWVHTNRHAFANPITTVNLSIGSNWNADTVPDWSTMEDELAQLKNDGIFISVSAGNAFSRYDTTGLSYPAASSYVVPVASVDDNGRLSSFSQRNSRVIAAPGRGIVSTVPDYRGNLNGRTDDFLSYSGTSMAAPYVAGASVLVRQALEFVGHTSVTQDTIYNHLRNTADTVFDAVTGLNYARLNIDRALDAIMPADDFASTAGGAYHLGSAVPSRTVAGLIGRLDDRDFFRFTAAHTGQLNIHANFSGATGVWQISGLGVNNSGQGANISLNVIAGQTYTLNLGASGGVTFYNLSFAQVDPVPRIFNEAFYLNRYVDVRMAVQAGYLQSGLQHFLLRGEIEGRSPFAQYDEASYLGRNADVRAAVQQGRLVSGVSHFLRAGQFEGRSPSASFDEAYYLSRYTDVRAAVQQGWFTSGLEHFVLCGQREGRVARAPGVQPLVALAASNISAGIQTAANDQPGAEWTALHATLSGAVSAAFSQLEARADAASGPGGSFDAIGNELTSEAAGVTVLLSTNRPLDQLPDLSEALHAQSELDRTSQNDDWQDDASASQAALALGSLDEHSLIAKLDELFTDFDEA